MPRPRPAPAPPKSIVVTLAPPPPATETPEERLARFNRALRWNHFMGGQRPTVPQSLFMLDPRKELLFGGAAGGGKSSALLMGALQFVDIPGYAALIVARTYQRLSKPGMLMPRARDWLQGTGATWNEETHTWTFPSRATLSFGYLEHEGDELQYQGSEFQYIAFEELTQFPEPRQYLYLFSRLRKLANNPIPVRLRAATNPGGPGHDWVKVRFGLGRDENGNPLPPPPDTRLFVPAKLSDNPYLAQDEYRAGLAELDAVTRAQLEDGNWDVAATGDLFFPERIRVLPSIPEELVQFRCRAVDKAGTEGGGAYTVLLRMAHLLPGQGYPEWVVEDIVRGQWSSERREAQIHATMLRDPIGTRPDDRGLRPTLHLIEQEPGSGGKESAELTVKANPGIWIEVFRPTGDKVTRMRPFSVAVNNYNVGIIRAPWNDNYLNELRAAPNGVYFDQLDTSGAAYNRMALAATPMLPASAPGQMRALPPGARF